MDESCRGSCSCSLEQAGDDDDDDSVRPFNHLLSVGRSGRGVTVERVSNCGAATPTPSIDYCWLFNSYQTRCRPYKPTRHAACTLAEPEVRGASNELIRCKTLVLKLKFSEDVPVQLGVWLTGC